MVLLDATHVLRMVLAQAVATGELSWTVDFIDHTNLGGQHGVVGGESDGTTDVDMLLGVAAGTQRQVLGMSIHNADTVAAEVRVWRDLGSGPVGDVVVVLVAGSTLQWSRALGWVVTGQDGTSLLCPLLGAVDPADLIPDVYNCLSGPSQSALVDAITTRGITAIWVAGNDETIPVVLPAEYQSKTYDFVSQDGTNGTITVSVDGGSSFAAPPFTVGSLGVSFRRTTFSAAGSALYEE